MYDTRLNYYTGQFFQKEDFIDEQEYHIQARTDHQKHFHSWGIASGLDLSGGTGVTVNISEGTAADINGNLIRLPQTGYLVDLENFAATGTSVYITIKYNENLTNEFTGLGTHGFTRITEEPIVSILNDPPIDPSTELILGRVLVGTTYGLVSSYSGFDLSGRHQAGITLGALELNSMTFTNNTTPANRPTLSGMSDGTKQVNLDGNLGITGALSMTGSLTMTGNMSITGDITFNGATNTITAANLEVTDNILRVNKYAPQATPLAINGGIEVFRGGDAAYPNAQITWDETTGQWKAGLEGALGNVIYGNNIFSDVTNGNISIGSNSFGGKLHITGGAATNSFNNTNAAIEIDNSGSGNTVVQANGTLGAARLTVEDGSTRVSQLWNAWYDQAGGGHKYDTTGEIATQIATTNSGLSLKTAPPGTAGNLITWNPGINIGTSGNVGIGKAPGTEKLEVEGGISANGSLTVTGNITGGGITASGDLTAVNITASQNIIITGTITLSGTIIQEAWTAATLDPTGGWTNYGNSYYNAEYMKDKNGFVHFRGRIAPGTLTDGTIIFTLPSGYIPASHTTFPVTEGQAFGQVNVNNDGTVKIYSVSGAWLSLDGIYFYVG